MALMHFLRRGAGATLATAAALSVAGCEAAAPATRTAAQRTAAPAAPAVREVFADTATLDLPRAYPSQVYVEYDVAVAARSAGVLDSVFVHLGSHVRAGALLGVVDGRGQEIEAARARERSERARATMQRAHELAKSGGVTAAESEQLAGELRQAELNVQTADRALALTRITAPFAGVVTARYARPRQLVAEGDTLFRVAETGPELVRVRVAEAVARGVQHGDRAVVHATTGAASVAAWVVFAAPALDPTSGTREVILQLGAPRFLVGESVSVELGSARRVVIVAPLAAIAAGGYALVVQDGRATMRSVTIGAALPDGRVEIVSGLAAGERLAMPRR
jgi:membrane fusion protein, multidrug efflux system